MIKIIIGSEEQYDNSGANTELPINAFHVNESLLTQNSRFFAILLNSSPTRTVVYIPKLDLEATEIWLNYLFRGEIATDGFKLDNLQHLAKCFEFANFVGSPDFYNQIMDSIQTQGVDGLGLEHLGDIDPEGWGDRVLRFQDYVIECLAYRVVSRGWDDFLDSQGVDKHVKDISALSHTGVEPKVLNALSKKVARMMQDKKQGKLVNPSERKDCKWHEHKPTDKMKCPRSAGASVHKSGDAVVDKVADKVENLLLDVDMTLDSHKHGDGEQSDAWADPSQYN